MRPTPHSPSAVSPSSGPTSSTPRAASVSAFSRVAGCAHIRGFIAGATRIGPRCASAASVSRLSDEAVRELRQRVRGAGSDDEQVGARQMQIQVLAGRPARERHERLGTDEALGAGRDERDHLVPGLDEQARELAGLVRRDAPGNPEQDPAHLSLCPPPAARHAPRRRTLAASQPTPAVSGGRRPSDWRL